MSDKPPPYPEQQPPPGAYPQPGFAPQQPGYLQPPGYPQQPGYPVQPAPYPVANQPGFSSSNTTTIITQQPQVTHLVTTGFHEAPVATTCPTHAVMDEGFRLVTWTVLGRHVLPLNKEKE